MTWVALAIAALIAALIALPVFAMVDSQGRRDGAFNRADRICGGLGEAQSVDIQGQDRIAFVCRKDGPLKELSY